MGRLPGKTEEVNFSQLGEFKLRWKDSEGYTVNSFAEVVKFTANIIYKWDRNQKIFRSSVTISFRSGPEGGRIDIAETQGATVSHFHLSFQPAWQTYAFNSATGSLIVSGTSDKMGGPYSVEIAPSLEDGK